MFTLSFGQTNFLIGNRKQYQLQSTTSLKYMKRGHRRTQSANFTSNPSEQSEYIAYSNQKINTKNGIPNLLNQCQVNIIQKICNVESLNVQIKGEQDKMFNFGRGLSKNKQDQRQKFLNQQVLVSIPQKLKKTANRIKKSSQTDIGSISKAKQGYNSILKISNKQIDKSKVVNDAINKIIKMKMGNFNQKKYRKLSQYQGETKMASKQVRHKKEISNIK